ncbi:MAG TPA: hypothetical protein VD886_07170 [Herpetosiphonaceae bacterium]|nr:hypothetical protein [Herpetosiphonaceae bacterium]
MSDETTTPADDQTAIMEQQVKELANLTEDDLFRTLGMQMKQAELAQENNPAALEAAIAKGAFDAPEGAEMGLGENLRAFGARWWGDIEPHLYNLLCKEDNPQRNQILGHLPGSANATANAAAATGSSGSASADAIALALAPLLIGLLPFNLPIIATAGATIAAKLILSSGLKTTCEMWQESIEEREKAKAKDAPPSDAPAA